MSSCPCGQAAGADDWLIGRVRSKVSPQARQRYSYRGMQQSYLPVEAQSQAVKDGWRSYVCTFGILLPLYLRTLPV